MSTFEDEVNKIKDKENAKLSEDRLYLAFKNILDTKDGKLVFKALLDMCPVDIDCFSTDSNLTAYNCGRHAFGVELRNYLKIKFTNNVINDIEKTEY